MKRVTLFCLAFLTLGPIVLNAAPAPGSNAKDVGRVVVFPVRHPLATLKGFFYGTLKSVGTVVDLVERGAAAVHAGVSKVDETIDKIENGLEPPAPAPAVIRHTSVDEQPVAIPGCAAKAFVPKGCYPQIQAELVEVRCPGQTFKFHCSEKP